MKTTNNNSVVADNQATQLNKAIIQQGIADEINKAMIDDETKNRGIARIFLKDVRDDIIPKYENNLSDLLINPANPEPEPEALLTLHGTPILWRGGKSFVCAVAKARKTTTLTMFAAILCGRDESEIGFAAGKNIRVLYVDTEQSRADSQRILFRTAKLCNVEPQELAGRLQVLSLNQQSPEDIRFYMEIAVKQYSPDVVILDNWTDCVNSVNDDYECTTFSRQLRMFAENYNLAVFSVIHANESAKNDSKPNFRGWGAEEARKSDLTLFLKDMGDYSDATFGRCRGKRPDGFCVSIDGDGLPYIFQSDTESNSNKENPDKFAAVVSKIPTYGINYKDLCNLIMDTYNVKIGTAKNRIAMMLNADAIVKPDTRRNGLYYRAEDKPISPTQDPLPF